jgi:hypothetical protein
MALALTNKRRWRFSLASLFFLMFCLCGLFAGYRVGYSEGKSGWAKARLIVKTYPVADLVSGAPSGSGVQTIDFKSLTDAIRVTVAPETWKRGGLGQGEMQPYPANLSLIVALTNDVHEQLSAMLGALRQAQRAVQTKTKKF